MVLIHIEYQLGFVYDGTHLHVRLLCGSNDAPSTTFEHDQAKARERMKRFRARQKAKAA